MRNNDHSAIEHHNIADQANGDPAREILGTDIFRTSRARNKNGHSYIIGDVERFAVWMGFDGSAGNFIHCLKSAGIGVRKHGKEAWVSSNGDGAAGHVERIREAMRIARDT